MRLHAIEPDMLEVVDWRCCQPSDVIQRAVELLHRGRLVVLPTGAGYELAASCQVPEAVAWLQEASERPLTMAVSGPAQLIEWIPQLSKLGRRLARNCWPGPLTILVAETQTGLPLPAEVRRRLCRQGAVAFRVPPHAVIQEVLSALAAAGPVALTEVGPSASTEMLQPWGDHVALVIADPATSCGEQDTVIRLDGERWQMVHEGAISAAEIDDLSCCRILFVCTGNTCRSPLAQALCAKLLAERLGCPVAELPQRGFIVQSAGLAAMMGGGAADEAAAVAGDLGADLSGHCSQPLTLDLLLQADFLFVMTRSHLQILRGLEAHGGPPPRLLSSSGEDIPDPIGSSPEVYRECAGAIVRDLEVLLPELQTSN
jgi:protein-tyrosine phosphatase